MPPASTRARPPKAPLTGAMWLAARATLAARRTRRFTRWWLGIGGVATVVALLVPVAQGDPQRERLAEITRLAGDTARAAEALRRAANDVALADSVLARARAAASAAPPARRAPRVAAPPSAAPPSESPALVGLSRAIAAARAERAAEPVLALAAHETVRDGPRMRATADSFRRTADAIDRSRLAGTIIAMAEYRLSTLRAAAAASAPTPVPAPAEPARVASAPGPVAPVAGLDTTRASELLGAERDTLAQAERADQAARAALAAAEASLVAARAEVPIISPGLALLALVTFGFALRLSLALMRELGSPRVAHVLEAERAVGAPVLSHVRDALPEGPLRFRPSGVDPFRVLYLQLTSTGTRTRAVIVTGDDLTIATAAAARLAIAAAADHRSTLVAELDTEHVALARLFRDQPEPGVSDAMAGAFKWREVARAVGSSDGLSIAMLPAGTTRDPVSAERHAMALLEFAAFREGFEFSIIVAPLEQLAEARALLPGEPVVLCATAAVTPLTDVDRGAAQVESAGDRVHSLVLWDAPRPQLPSRAELAAWLSKRKGRTPGGSFKAVQEAINKPPT